MQGPLVARAVMLVLVFVLAPGVGAQAPAAADPASPVAAGTRVRLRIHPPRRFRFIQPQDRHVVGTLIRVGDDSVVVERRRSRRSTPRTAVVRLEVSASGRRRGVGALRGAALGLVAGAAGGAMLGESISEGCSGSLCPARGPLRRMGALAFGATGLVVGGVGGAIQGAERWRAVPLDLASTAPTARLAVMPRGVMLSLRF